MSECKSGAASIKVIGIGAAGCNTITRMVKANVHGLEYIAMDTDADYLEITEAPVRICLGEKVTAGLGADGNPTYGLRAAEEARDQIQKAIAGADILFLVTGLGGGTGSGAIPVVADIAKQSRILTVAIVTKPFGFEGSRRRIIAEESVKQLMSRVNPLIIVENNEIIGLARDFSVEDAFNLIDRYLGNGIKAIVEPSRVRGDFTSVKNVLGEMSLPMINIGDGFGQNRVANATKEALKSKNGSVKDVKTAILSLSSKTIVSNSEIEIAKWTLKQEINPDARVLIGAFIDPVCDDNEIHVTLICDFIKMATKYHSSCYGG